MGLIRDNIATAFWLVGSASYGLRAATCVTKPELKVHFLAGTLLVFVVCAMWIIVSMFETALNGYRVFLRLMDHDYYG